ncbi:MAG: hypothetical protein OHK005_20910 [Candidatus Methylacidiphilales bacterium]
MAVISSLSNSRLAEYSRTQQPMFLQSLNPRNDASRLVFELLIILSFVGVIILESALRQRPVISLS